MIVDLAHSVDYKGMLGRSSTTIVLDTSPMKLFTTLHGLQVRILYFFPHYETSKLQESRIAFNSCFKLLRKYLENQGK